MTILCINPLPVKFFKRWFLWRKPTFWNYPCENTCLFSLWTRRCPYCPVNVLVSMPNRFKTIIIHLDIVGVETGPCRFTKLNRDCGFCPRISFALLRYKLLHWQTHWLWFSLKIWNLIGSPGLDPLDIFAFFPKWKV